jgi:hypothetical protein
VNRIATTSPKWSLRRIGFLILGYACFLLTPAHAWQVNSDGSWFLREAEPPVLYGSIPHLLSPGELGNEIITVSAPMLLGPKEYEESAQGVLQIAQSPRLTELSGNGPLSTDSKAGLDEGLTNDSLRQGFADPYKRYLYQPALPFLGQDGNLYLKPNLRVEEHISQSTSIFSSYAGTDSPSKEYFDVDQYSMDPSTSEAKSILSNGGSPVDGYSFIGDYGNPVATRRGRRDLGIGHERLPFALSHISASQPFNNIRIRSDFQYGWQFPNRAEYLWAGPPKGPKIPEVGLDLQEYSMLMEMGSETFSVGTELPLIWLNPTINPNTSGFGDMSVTTKLVLLKGQSLQLTQITRTHTPTGQASSGRGNGHVSMEPGLIARYSWEEQTMFHGMVTFFFPIGGDPNFSGEVLEYSFGIARVWYDSDQFAIIPTIESVNWAVLSGAKGIKENKISGDYISNLHPGVRFVFDRGGDLGLFEVGFGTGFSLTDNHFYQSLFRFDLRWSY